MTRARRRSYTRLAISLTLTVLILGLAATMAAHRPSTMLDPDAVHATSASATASY